MDTPSGISTGSLHGVVWLAVEGRGSFRNSPELKSMVRAGIDEGRARMVVDLQRCSGMDSTFMGMLSCVAVKLEDAGGGLHVVNAGGKNGDLLRGLGLDEVFTVEDGAELLDHPGIGCVGHGAEALALAAIPQASCSKQDQKEICLEAHEALAGLHETNAEKFRDVITLMRQKPCPAEAGR